MRVSTETERRMIEEDLIRGLKPKMNDVQMPRHENDAPNTPSLRRSWQFRRALVNWFKSLVGRGEKHGAVKN
jgi:hypothetical protein